VKYTKFLKAFQRKRCTHLPIKSDVRHALLAPKSRKLGLKRRYEKHFVSKLTDADGEQQETQHWLETALDCDYISEAQAKDWLGRYVVVGRMINSMIDKASQFCSSR